MANPSDNTKIIAALSDMLGLDKDKVISHLEGLGIDDYLEMIDALNADDSDGVKSILLKAKEGDDETQEGDEEEDDEESINPLLTKDDIDADVEGEKDVDAGLGRDTDLEVESNYQPNIGQEVLVRQGDETKKGIVKITRAPKGTVGVMIDGALKMVKKGNVTPLEESILGEGVLGMTMMPDLRRMQQLAGVTPGAENHPGAAPSAAPVEPSLSIPPVPLPSTPVTDVTMPEENPEAVIQGGSRIDAAFGEIELVLPSVPFAEIKNVRARLNQLLAKLNEGEAPRKKKV